MASPLLGSHEVAPLTRKDVKEELHAFAKGWLAQALQEAMRDQHNLIASEVCKRIQEEKIQGRVFGSQAPSGLEANPSPQNHAMRRSSLSMPGSRLSNNNTADRGFWQPSLKYEARHAARSHAEVPRAAPPDSPRRSASYSSLSPAVRASLDHPEEHHHVQARLSMMIESAVFEQVSGLCVLLNAISLGYDTNQMATNPGAAPSQLTDFTEPFFCFIFLAEFLLRVGAFGWDLFSVEGWRWNILDMILVSTQCLEQVLIFLSTFTLPENTVQHEPNIGIFRVLRLLRIARIARLLRAFHLFDDLRVIVSSIMSSVTSLGWSIFLLLILIYAFSLVFLQSIVSSGHTEHHEQIHYWFASLFRTFLTMFECVVGGVSWDEVVAPIVSDISPVLGVAFCIYIAACLFAMMNLLTGVFVDKAMMSVREDKDIVLAKRIRDLFLAKAHWDEDTHEDEEITWEGFQRKLDTPAMKDYFFQINVDITEAHMLFELMDADGSGSLSSEEIIKACLSLRGPARALEMSMVMKDVSDLRHQIKSMQAGMQRLLVMMEPIAHAQWKGEF